jgi:hypothetical protein
MASIPHRIITLKKLGDNSPSPNPEFSMSLENDYGPPYTSTKSAGPLRVPTSFQNLVNVRCAVTPPSVVPIVAGLVDGAGIFGTLGDKAICFRCTGSGNWQCITRLAPTGFNTTITDSGVLVQAGVEYNMVIERKELSVEFWINGVLVQEHEVNIPGPKTFAAVLVCTGVDATRFNLVLAHPNVWEYTNRFS